MKRVKLLLVDSSSSPFLSLSSHATHTHTPAPLSRATRTRTHMHSPLPFTHTHSTHILIHTHPPPPSSLPSRTHSTRTHTLYVYSHTFTPLPLPHTLNPTPSVEKLFAPLPLKLPSYMRQKPRCTDIVELPYSMAAMDHLEPIMYRTTLRINKQTGEKGLRKVGIFQ